METLLVVLVLHALIPAKPAMMVIHIIVYHVKTVFF